MTSRTARVRLVCAECKHATTGSPGDEWRYGCDRCGGPLKVIRYGPRKRKPR